MSEDVYGGGTDHTLAFVKADERTLVSPLQVEPPGREQNQR
jgi:hypothetical protein